MKKILLLLFVFLPLFASAQEKQSVVILKNGTELKGVIKAIDPTDALTIVIAGVEAKIKMADVAKVEEIANDNNAVNVMPQIPTNSDEKLVVTDKADYPESFDLKIGNESIKMILVRGGDLNMGFNGRHSRAMNSEPIHKVGVTSFYISETFVTSDIVSEVSKKTSRKDYYKTSWKKANEFVESIASKVGLPIRLPLEAEWEYAACSHVQEKIFDKCQDFEYCYDFFDDYKDTEYRIDPKGPSKGLHGMHVLRGYLQDKGKLTRKPSESDYHFRIAIKAKDIKQ